MKKIALVLFAGAIAILLAALSSYAQPRGGMMWRGSGGWGPGSQYNRMYDPKAVETITGEVTAVDRITPVKGMSGGVHMNVKTDKETISVQLGPSWYLENQDVKIVAERQGRGERRENDFCRQTGDHRGGGEEGR